jgi:hypothetical protein
MKEMKLIEPLKSNRWLIRTEGMDIKPYLFRKYKIFNEGEDIIFKTEFYETVEQSYNPKDILNIVGFTIEYLDPTGTMVNGLKFDVKGINFEQNMSYGKYKFMITKIRVIIDKNTLNLIHKIEE